ncbi:MAG: rRNA maturation RNase YbeY [Candidatus Pacebacteria bacterium]|nr:rRNA maturation RNase YbeY [Candidatus Paceibacterota bacterium]
MLKIRTIKKTAAPRLANRSTLVKVLYDIARLTGIAEKYNTAGCRYELVVAMIGRRTMKRLNTTFLGHNWDTDVLAFNLDEPMTQAAEETVQTIGEIYLCPAIGEQAAKQYNTTIARELTLYAIHGMLHLAGMTDASPPERAIMQERQEDILSELQTRHNLEEIFE